STAPFRSSRAKPFALGNVSYRGGGSGGYPASETPHLRRNDERARARKRLARPGSGDRSVYHARLRLSSHRRDADEFSFATFESADFGVCLRRHGVYASRLPARSRGWVSVLFVR